MPEYWIVDPDARTLEVWLLTPQGQYVDSRRIVSGSYECATQPGLRVDLGPLFEELGPK